MAGRAEAALQGVVALEGGPEGVQQRVFPLRRLHGVHATAVNLHRQSQTGACRHAVDAHGAGATDAVFTADVGARRAEFVPQKIAEQKARLGLATAFAAVEGEVDRVQGIASENRVTHVCLRAC